MDYIVNPSVFSQAFAFPSDVADKYLKFCKGEHLKVLIYLMRNNNSDITENAIADAVDITPFEVKEALLFWADAGILICNNFSASKEPKSIAKKNIKPTKQDITKRGLQDPKLKYLLSQTAMILCRDLKENEIRTLGWLYDDLGLDVSVLLYIVEYAKQQDKLKIGFIESLACDWVEKGVETIADAEEQIRLTALSQQAWSMVCKAFGIERRKPSKKESELSNMWINVWQFSEEMLVLAYETCVDTKSKFTFPYVAKIIENWNKKGFKTPEDVENDKKANEKMQGAYNIDLFEKMLDSKD